MRQKEIRKLGQWESTNKMVGINQNWSVMKINIM